MNDDDDDDDDGANRWAGIEKERRKTNKFNGSISKSNEKKILFCTISQKNYSIDRL